MKTNCAVFVTFSFSPKDTLLAIYFVVGTSSFVIHKIICTYDKLCLSYHNLPILAYQFFHQGTPGQWSTKKWVKVDRECIENIHTHVKV